MIAKARTVALMHDHAMELPAASIDRQQRLIWGLEAVGLTGGRLELPRRKARMSDLALVHERAYLEGLKAISDAGTPVKLDPELEITSLSWPAASAAAGAMCEALFRAQPRQIPFCLSRPGSHHAGPDYGLGLCIVNNLAVAAAVAIQEELAERVAILDFDAHHGNGTQEIFYSNPQVLTISIHQFPFFPGTGAADETGQGLGKGANMNLPLSAGARQVEALEAYDRAMERLALFRPQVVLVEAGVDGHFADWTSELALDDETYFLFGRRLGLLCEVVRASVILEQGGGYTSEAVIGGLGSFLRGIGT